MTKEKEKAQELYWFFWQEVADCYKPETLAKTMATRVCKEIISACEYNQVESYNTEWWNRVINEIENHE